MGDRAEVTDVRPLCWCAFRTHFQPILLFLSIVRYIMLPCAHTCAHSGEEVSAPSSHLTWKDCVRSIVP